MLSGPSGVGKGTVVAEVRRRHPEVWVSVSVTTRARRPGEVDGVHYHFLTGAEFDRLVAEDGLLEWAEYAGNRYGTPAAPVRERLATGAPALLEIELQGARQVRARAPEAQLVFLAPPSWAELRSRLAGRGSEPPAVQERRLAIAQAELDAAGEFDAVVVNDDVTRAADELVGLLTAPSSGRSVGASE
ncbi:guanylate kinase [Geodermatophilus tzadiensis]|uniref:Guanylate kinase n=1 Tax=Geodermatophilus tzadiensis TaxID=1137988 RepID=A0A2T0TYC8_9ACTN|nr:guanylate kinase [Geodermatophilus tzadiensis]